MPVKKCSKCGDGFQCGCDASGCWCEGLTVEKTTLEQLKNQFDNCLCPKCLEQYSSKDIKNRLNK